MMRVYLIGFMACGKSFLSKRLAKEMNLNLIDVDRFIEEKYFMTVADIFEKHGEDVFRKREKEAISEISNIENLIVATGGGAPCFYDNMELMNKSGITLYIKVPEEVIVERLMNSNNIRPLAAGKTKEELTSFVSRKIKERELFYLKSHAIINPLEQSLNEIVTCIKNLS